MRTILLIDYDPKTIEYTRSSLAEAGYAVEVASDGITGLACFERVRPDLVVVEAMLPKKHGFEVCREIKHGSGEGPTVPVIITTSSHSGRRHRYEAMNTYGCDEYLEKPVGKQRLLSICRGLLEGESADEAVADSRPLPDLDNMTEEQLTAELDRLVPVIDDPVSDDAIAEVARADEPAALPGDPQVRPEPTEETTDNALARLSDLTEEEIVTRLDSVLARRARERRESVADDDGPTVEGTDTAPSSDAAESESTGTIAPPDVGRPEAVVATVPPVAPPTPVARTASAPPTHAPVAEKAPAARPTATRRSERKGNAPSASRSQLKWLGIAACFLALCAAGWFGVAMLPGQALSDTDVASRPQARPAHTAVPSSPSETTTFTGTPQAPAPAGADDVAAFEHAVTPVDQTPAPVEPSAPRRSLADDRGQNVAATMPTSSAASRTRPDGMNTATRIGRETAPPPADRDVSTKTVVKRSSRTADATVPTFGSPRDSGTPTATAEPQAESSTPSAPVTAATDGATSVPREVHGENSGGLADDAHVPEQPDVLDYTQRPASNPLVEAAGLAGPLSVRTPAPAEPSIAPGTLLPIEAVDRVPVLVKRTMPDYDPFARRLKQQGTVKMRLLVDEHGDVADVELVSGIPTSRLNDRAIQAARTWKYEPATKGGVPVRVWTPAEVDFKL